MCAVAAAAAAAAAAALLLLLLVRGGLMTGIRYRPVVDKALAFH